MDMSNVPTGSIVAPNVDVAPIKKAIKERAVNLAEQMSPEAASQFEKDMSNIEPYVVGDGETIRGGLHPSPSYLLEYLKNHDTPVSGGDNGIAHNVDGSTYVSEVPVQLQGTLLPDYELPILDGEDEAHHLMEIMFPDAVREGVKNSSHAIADAVMPQAAQEIKSFLGGVYQ